MLAPPRLHRPLRKAWLGTKRIKLKPEKTHFENILSLKINEQNAKTTLVSCPPLISASSENDAADVRVTLPAESSSRAPGRPRTDSPLLKPAQHNLSTSGACPEAGFCSISYSTTRFGAAGFPERLIRSRNQAGSRREARKTAERHQGAALPPASYLLPPPSCLLPPALDRTLGTAEPSKLPAGPGPSVQGNCAGSRPPCVRHKVGAQ